MVSVDVQILLLGKLPALVELDLGRAILYYKDCCLFLWYSIHIYVLKSKLLQNWKKPAIVVKGILHTLQ